MIELKIEQPTLFVNKEQVLKNIRKMVEKAEKSNVIFRPHFKTHQSAEVGNWYKEFNVNAITVSSVDMAEYFADNGWKDITIAFPVNILQIDRINKLAEKITLNLLVESEDSVTFLNENILAPVNIWIKIDTGYNRTGIFWDNEPILSHLIRSIKKSERLKFAGFLVHSGNSYHTKSTCEIEEVYEDTIIKLKNLQERMMLQGFSIVKLSIGDTPCCSVVKDFSDVNEIRPGNFVFYDFMQYTLGVCSENEIAVALACPVVALHPEREEILVYGGAIHLSKDNLVLQDGSKIFGAIALPDKNGWGKIIDGIFVKSISQEHGIIHASKQFISNLKIGDILYIIPIHSCLTANLMKKYYTLENQEILMIPCKK